MSSLHAMPGIAALKAISFAPNSHVKNQGRVDNKLLSARRSQTENQRTKMIELSWPHPTATPPTPPTPHLTPCKSYRESKYINIINISEKSIKHATKIPQRRYPRREHQQLPFRDAYHLFLEMDGDGFLVFSLVDSL